MIERQLELGTEQVEQYLIVELIIEYCKVIKGMILGN